MQFVIFKLLELYIKQQKDEQKKQHLETFYIHIHNKLGVKIQQQKYRAKVGSNKMK